MVYTPTSASFEIERQERRASQQDRRASCDVAGDDPMAEAAAAAVASVAKVIKRPRGLRCIDYLSVSVVGVAHAPSRRQRTEILIKISFKTNVCLWRMFFSFGLFERV